MTGREHRARLMGHDIYRAADFDILPLNPNVPAQSPPHPVEGHLLALVRSHLLGGQFLFSYAWDLSRRLQTQWNEREDDEKSALWEQVSLVFPSTVIMSDSILGGRQVLLEQVHIPCFN
jgi:hypothetical protein